MSFDKCMQLSNHQSNQYIICFRHPQISLCPSLMVSLHHPFHFPAPSYPWSVFCHYRLEFQINGIIECTLCVWLLSLSKIFLKFIHVAMYGPRLLFLIAEQYSVAWIFQHLFSHMTVDGRLDCFHVFLLYFNKAALNICVWVFVWTHQVFLARVNIRNILPWLVWLNGLSASLRSRGLLVQFPVRAHAWVAGQVPSRGCVRGNHTLMFLSLSFPSPV